MKTGAKLENMNRSTVHDLTPTQNCRDRARQGFVFHVKRKLGAIASRGLPGIARKRAGTVEPGYAVWSALNKGSQRRM